MHQDRLYLLGGKQSETLFYGDAWYRGELLCILLVEVELSFIIVSYLFLSLSCAVYCLCYMSAVFGEVLFNLVFLLLLFVSLCCCYLQMLLAWWLVLL